MITQLVAGEVPDHQQSWGPSQRLEPKLAKSGHNHRRDHHLVPSRGFKQLLGTG